MNETEHIPTERMIEVATKCDELLSEAEEQHVEHCLRCLVLFEHIVLRDDEADTNAA